MIEQVLFLIEHNALKVAYSKSKLVIDQKTWSKVFAK
jgi:hypothetical protein